ncbi:hypothetical protein ND16A_1710 [Thalassotalea sp. ND16A]|nr:hypothetical protein ND16A_1710 [Thalassotalea sp. ND16A]
MNTNQHKISKENTVAHTSTSLLTSNFFQLFIQTMQNK